jgi:hypothetical protein
MAEHFAKEFAYGDGGAHAAAAVCWDEAKKALGRCIHYASEYEA